MSADPILSSPRVVRVREALAATGVDAEIVVLPAAAHTAKLAAAALGCTPSQIANSLVFRLATSGVPVLVMSSGGRRVDEARAAAFFGEPLAKADADFVREHTGFVIGGVAPVGHVHRLRTVIEASLMSFDRVWAAAGHPSTVFALTPDALVRATGGEIADLAWDA